MKIFTYLDTQNLVNQYLVATEDKNAILIDASTLNEDMLHDIEKNKLNVSSILITHHHSAHTKALEKILKIYDAAVYSYFPSIDGRWTIRVKDSDVLHIGKSDIKCIHLPGHSIDSMAYLIDGYALFTGDSLECGMLAVTNTITEKEILVRSIREKVFSLDDNTLLFPGHGALSKVRIEKMFNQDILEVSAKIFSN